MADGARMIFLGFGKYARAHEGAESGRLDLADLQRRARRLLEATTSPDDGEKLF